MPALLRSKTTPIFPMLPPSLPQRVRVLLVEDSLEQAQLTQFLIETGRGEFDVTWKGTLLSAMECLKESEVDVVLLDLGMPELGNWQSYAAIRAISPSVPVVVLTSDGDPKTKRSLFNRGVRYFLLKEETDREEICACLRLAAIEGS